jgi:hypothetical protein
MDMTDDLSSLALLAKTADDITSLWMGRVLGVDDAQVERVQAIGTGQMSQNYRVEFRVDGEHRSVVVKLASSNETSRATGVQMGAYWREVEFYRNLAPKLGWPIPKCDLAVNDETDGWFTLVLEDVAGGTQGDQIAGCTVDEARTALASLAAIQAPVLGNPGVGGPWLNLPNMLSQELLSSLLPAFTERYAGRIKPAHVEVCRRFVSCLDAWWLSKGAPEGLVHGDFRLDNLLFTTDSAAVVDWQTVMWGPALLDAAYFLGGALSPEERRTHERELIGEYHAGLIRRGVEGLGWEQCWQEYRKWSFWGVTMVIGASMLVVQTERGDDMFMTLLDRACSQVLDLDALELLPVAEAAVS